MSSKAGYLQRYLIIIQNVRRKKHISMDELINAVNDEIAFFQRQYFKTYFTKRFK
jgi:hypothetical protein